MKIAVPSRHGRLLALCGLSAALHLLCLALIARDDSAPAAPVPGAEAPLVLRLAPAHAAPAPAPAAPVHHRASSARPAPASSASPAGRAPAMPAAQVATESAPGEAGDPAAPHAPSPPASAVPPAAPLAASADAAAPPAPGAEAGGAPSHGDTDVQALVRYRVRMPPPVRLLYTLTRRDAAGRTLAPLSAPQPQSPPGTPQQPAWLDWRSDGEHYTLDMDGVLGRASSSGVSGDEGILPQRYVERRGERASATGFDTAAHRIVFADGGAAPDAPGMQDRASLLMQLAGIGLARPAQVQGDIEIVVAGAADARVEHFQVMGQEPVDTGDGTVSAWRLVQRSAPGEARLEVWLAPERGWLPVQLRLSQPDGSSATQVLARLEAPAP